MCRVPTLQLAHLVSSENLRSIRLALAKSACCFSFQLSLLFRWCASTSPAPTIPPPLLPNYCLWAHCYLCCGAMSSSLRSPSPAARAERCIGFFFFFVFLLPLFLQGLNKFNIINGRISITFFFFLFTVGVCRALSALNSVQAVLTHSSTS